ncbi:ImmA/IrrE family metallo-endopeptidase [Candidatus Sumerlaeota bacterium]|nr:ImmA/IrrE family metallo-endopeptidase [Candidatus Sumerlaeota bacterium]
MPLNLQSLGKRLRQARENCGLSQNAVAQELGLQRTAVTRIESGERPVSTLELDRLARLYRRPIQEFFLEEAPGEEDMLVALYRLAPTIGASEQAKDQVAECLDLCREGRFLESVLDSRKAQSLPSYNYAPPSNAWDAINQGGKLADEERRRLGLGLSPVGDIEDLIAEQGIWAAMADLPDAMSGLFLRHPEVGTAIFVNAGHVAGRRRFSFAHEYAHALVDANRTISVSSQDNAQELVEKRANAFAAAFLMPEEGVREFLATLDKDRGARDVGVVFNVAGDAALDFGSRPKSALPITPQDAAYLAHHFGASYQAAVFRMRSLRILTTNEFDDLMNRVDEGKQYLSLFFEEVAEGKRDRELKFQIAHLAIEAYRRKIISGGRLREIAKKLGVSGGDLIRAAGGTYEE